MPAATQSVEVRAARPEDAPSLAQLLAGRADHDRRGPLVARDASDLAARVDEADAADVILVAEHAGRVVGFIAGHRLEAASNGARRPPGHSGAAALFVSHLGVESDAAGQGVARRLVDAVEARARHLGLGAVLVDAGVDPATAQGGEFWRDAMGYVPTGLVLRKPASATNGTSE